MTHWTHYCPMSRWWNSSCWRPSRRCSGLATGSAARAGSRSPLPFSAGLSLALKIDPGLVTNQNVAKTLIALLLVMPYCLFRFAATFRTPSRFVRVPGHRAHGRHRALHVHPHVPAGTGIPGAAALPGLPDRIRGGVRVPVRVRRRLTAPGRPGRAARSPPRACTSSRWRWPDWRFRWWWPHWGCRAPLSTWPRKRSPW